MGYLFNGLKDHCSSADGKGTPGLGVSRAPDWPQREVEVVRSLDDRGILEGSYITQKILSHQFQSRGLKGIVYKDCSGVLLMEVNCLQ